MTKIFILSTLFLTLNTLGQMNPEKINGLKIKHTENIIEKDSIIKIVYKNEALKSKNPAYFLNGKFIDKSILQTLNPNQILSVKVDKSEIEIENRKYYGKLIIETKDNYNPNLISLNNLKAKYLKLNKNKIIFKINDEIINANYNDFIVDENFIYTIIVENFENEGENLNVNFITLITKAQEFIKKSKKIILRGKEEIVNTK